jgi:eukaryotic-like serine/threonine-protein kinase
MGAAMGASSQFLPATKDLDSLLAALPRSRRIDRQSEQLHSLLAATLEKMADEWHAGAGRPVELWLAETPELATSQEDAVRMVYEEFCIREERGEAVEAEKYYQRFPQWREALAVVLECHALLKNDEPPDFPEAGESLGELRLEKELGRGALGRVFLATQPSLSDRPLAVKITARRGQEHLSLAQLQHTHIVPLYHVLDFPNENLRAMCMPFLGGVTWDAILKRLQKRPAVERTGEQIAVQLSAASGASPSPAVATGPALGFLTQSTYVDAVCWIGACLADALFYAHQRGLAHLDIKPSNVLMTGDGQPMLLDFHIASELKDLASDTIQRLGGTPEYMSPEQRAAADAIRRGEPFRWRLDGRSDIYSLGVLLYESLAGKLPPKNLGGLSKELQHLNPNVSRGLRDVICKCLANSPAARYQDASQLATDLRCHLAQLPLRGVANHSFLERLQKWRRRKPYAMPLAAIALAAVAIIGTVTMLYYRDRIGEAELLLQQSQQEFATDQFELAMKHASAAADAVTLFPWQGDLRARAKQQLATAEIAEARATLHNLVQQLRFLDGQPIEKTRLSKIIAGCNKVWQSRGLLLGASGNDIDRGSDRSDPESLRHDLLDFAILSARLELQIASPADAVAANERALRRLDEARQLCGTSPWLDLEARDYAVNSAKSTTTDAAPSLPTPTNSWEHHALGRWLMRQRQFADAEKEFALAIRLAPKEFWPHYRQMQACYELSQFDDALIAANVCVALEPQLPQCYYNRALCERELSRGSGPACARFGEQAAADFRQALTMDSDLSAADKEAAERFLRAEK